MTLLGFDCSNHQGTIDWGAVAASGRTFAWIKASEDPAYKDPYFAANWAGAKAAGLTRGAYHYARPSRSNPTVSTNLLMDQLTYVGGLQTGDLVALDQEDTDVASDFNLFSWTLSWLELVAYRFEFTVKPVLYSGVWFMAPHGLLDQPQLAAYPLWLAAYQTTQPPPPPAWTALAFWQHSSHGTVPGVAGEVDLDQFLGTAANLAALGKDGGTPVPPTDPAPALRDKTWALADQLQKLGADWRTAGYPHHASYVENQGEAIKDTVAISKSEK